MIQSVLDLYELGAKPATPTAGQRYAYPKSDGWYDENSGATERRFVTATAPAVLGDVIYSDATPQWQRLAGNITTTRKFLRQVGTGAVSAAPAWDTITGDDVPFHDAEFLCLSTHASLDNERIFVPSATNFSVTDDGAGGHYHLNTIQDIATTSTPQFARLGLGAAVDANVILYSTTAHATEPVITVNQSSTGDAYIRYALGSTISYAWGIDNSVAGDPLVLSTAASASAVLGTSLLTIASSGAITANQWVNIGTATSAVSQGDMASGLSAGNALFFDESIGSLFVGAHGTTIAGRLHVISAGSAVTGDRFMFQTIGSAGRVFLTLESTYTSSVTNAIRVDFNYTPVGSAINSRIAGIDIYTTATDNTSGAQMVFLTKVTSGALTEAMRITSAQFVGINTTGPDRRLDVLDSTNPQLRLTQADGAVWAEFQCTSAHALVFETSGTGGFIFNETQADRDFRIEGDSISHAFFLDATATTENIALLTTAAPNWQTMDRGFYVGDNTTEPTGNPTNGFFHYSLSGHPKWLGSSGSYVDMGSTFFGFTGNTNGLVQLYVANDSVGALSSAEANIYADKAAQVTLQTVASYWQITNTTDTGNPLKFSNGGNERMRLLAAGDLLLGTTTALGAGGGKCLVFGDNAGNPTPGSNTCAFYGKDVSGTVEAFACDEAGNAAQLTPHDPEGFYAPLIYSGKRRTWERYNMEKMIRFLEKQFGERWIDVVEVS